MRDWTRVSTEKLSELLDYHREQATDISQKWATEIEDELTERERSADDHPSY